MARHNIIANSKASSSDINDNFDYFDGEVQRLDHRVDGVQASMSSIGNTAKEAALKVFYEELEVVNATDTTQNEKIKTIEEDIKELDTNFYSYIAPDYTKATTVSSETKSLTTTSAGWLYVYHRSTGTNHNLTVTIDNVEILKLGNYNSGETATAQFYVDKGSAIAYDGKGTITLTFYPCKGGTTNV